MDKEITLDGFRYVLCENGLYENIDGSAIYNSTSSWGCADEHAGMNAIGYVTNSGFYVRYISLPDFNIRDLIKILDTLMDSDSRLVSIEAMHYPSCYVGGLF